MNQKHKLYVLFLRFLCYVLIFFSILFCVTIHGYCLGDEIFELLGLKAWSEGTQGLHYTWICSLILLIFTYFLFEKTVENKEKAKQNFWFQVLVIFLLLVVIVKVTGKPHITAEKITEYHGATILGGSTNVYQTYPSHSVDDYLWSPIRNNQMSVKELPVYTPILQMPEPEYAQNCADTFLSNLDDALNASHSEPEWREFPSESHTFYQYCKTDYDVLNATVSVGNDAGVLQTNYLLRFTNPDSPFITPIPLEPTNEEVISASAKVLELMNELANQNFEIGAIRHFYHNDDPEYSSHSLEVYAWEKSSKPVEEMYNMYFDHVRMSFSVDEDSSKEHMTLQTISYTANTLETAFHEAAELVSVKEALEFYEKGYLFGGHICSVCMENQKQIDFSEYDGIEICYQMNNFRTYMIPYYALYKQLESEQIVVTYVPAVHVSGLDSYFKQQSTFHNE